MPSTFTDSGIELIADGEQTGLWGQTTNLNLQIIDRLTSQAGTIALSGTTHTLTVSAGALSDGQYGVLVFAGSPSGTNTVTISPNTAQRTFIVRNTTTESVVLTQGSGGNVTVPTATTKIVYSDGGGASAAVVDLTSTLAANLLGNVTGNATGNAGTATALQTARTIGGVSFDGTANINLPGVNQAGNQNTSGTAATATLAADATKLATARTFTIGATGRTFDGTADVSWTTVEIGAVSQTSSTGAAVIPAGTDAQRPTPAAGQLRFNSTISKFEGYDGTAWGTVGGGGGFFKGENGSVGDATTGPGDIFRINEQELNTSVTISGTENASCTGPLAVASGVTLTVSAGGTLAVI